MGTVEHYFFDDDGVWGNGKLFNASNVLHLEAFGINMAFILFQQKVEPAKH